MKKRLLLPCLLLLSILAYGQKAAAKKQADPKTNYDLKEALQQKLVSVTVASTGGHEGESLTITCRNLSGKFLRLRIPQGQLMEPTDSTMQTLVVAEERSMALLVKTPAEAALRTFCTQAGDRSPMAGTRFSSAAMAPEKVCQLLKFMVEKGKLEQAGAQSAVWCLTSGLSLSGIGDAELLKFTAGLLGKEPPGYHVKYESREVPGERADLGKAMIVESNFRYTLDKDQTLSLTLYDANNKVIKVLRKDEPNKAGEHRSSLRLEVWNLDPGKYFVRLERKNGQLVQELAVEF